LYHGLFFSVKNGTEEARQKRSGSIIPHLILDIGKLFLPSLEGEGIKERV